ncbi:MAG TPA: protein translocase subunit SecD [Candidatus Paceibacterota bacterium]|nr:protein translocase subunit SecD [Candidatus Paceibacterota bacterium]
MLKVRLSALFLLLIGAISIVFVFYSENISKTERFLFKFGLDLDGGTHLTYRADVSGIDSNQIDDSMNSLRRTIERRVNLFGVSEPIVQIEKGGFFSDNRDDYRLIVELPGVTDVTEAIKQIGATPILEFKLEKKELDLADQNIVLGQDSQPTISLDISKLYESTGLTGSQLRRASLVFDSFGGQPTIQLNYNDDGRELLSKITSENIGRNMAIFLDGEIISNPVIRDKITNGEAIISGSFTPEEARELVRNLNFGALPAPIELIETQTIGPTLGKETVSGGIRALIYAFSLIFIFMLIWYRLSGLISIIALIFYVAFMLSLFKLIPVTLTAAGLAGFILSIGMAVDANILIFERIREELQKNSNLYDAIKTGSDRAWSSIRDGNLTSIISAVVLYWMSGTSLVQGFALVFGIGVLVSMFTAVVVSKILLLSVSSKKDGSVNNTTKILFGSGFGIINKLK